MTGDAYTTEVGGHRLEVTVGRRGLTTTVTVHRDGEVVGETDQGAFEPARVRVDDVVVEVEALLPGRVRRCDLLLPADDAGEPDDEDDADDADEWSDRRWHRVPFDPPPGTRAARTAALKRDHPTAYASRHVVIAVGQVVVVLLGLNLALRAVFGWIDWSWLPDVPTPSIDVPDPSALVDRLFGWVPDPFAWVPGVVDRLFGWVPDLSAPGWLEPLVDSSRYWIPVLIAIGIAGREIDRRRKADEAKRRRDASARSGDRSDDHPDASSPS